MPKVSIIIPSRNELFLPQTVNDLLTKASGDVEVIAVLEGYWPEPFLPENKNLKIIYHGKPLGMRAAINHGAAIAKGDFLMKCDAHCMFGEGYDEILSNDCDDNWIVIPRRYSLDAENWDIEKNGKPPRDYHYLCYPQCGKDHDNGMHGVEWWGRGKERSDSQYDIDDNMSFQGSCWFMKKTYFTDFLHGMSEEGYGTFTQEPQEIGLKAWLGGGAIKVNKKIWYAHLHKGSRYGRMYHQDRNEVVRGHNYSADYWMNNRWENRVHNIDWLIEKFWPVPTWPEDRSLWTYPNG
jgi:glycosyltransferase involved in cell wall biosynthesis